MFRISFLKSSYKIKFWPFLKIPLGTSRLSLNTLFRTSKTSSFSHRTIKSISTSWILSYTFTQDSALRSNPFIPYKTQEMVRSTVTTFSFREIPVSSFYTFVTDTSKLLSMTITEPFYRLTILFSTSLSTKDTTKILFDLITCMSGKTDTTESFFVKVDLKI